jgi:predicted ABC-type exoprotein transport system permease subunit
MLSDLFDEYSFEARVRPALLAVLPLVLALYIVVPVFYNVAAAVFSIFVTCGLITALAHYSRYRGRETEKRLFKLWKGKPSTILLRHTDDTIDRHTKARYHNYLSEKITGWTAPSVDDEKKDLADADKFYDSAIRWLLEKTRDKKKYRLLFKENILYGFRRNVRGIKWLGVVTSLIAIFLISCTLFRDYGSINLKEHSVEIGMGAFSVIMLLWWAFVVTDTWVKDAAESYALRLVSSCEG